MKRSLKRNKVKADINVISDLNEENPIEKDVKENGIQNKKDFLYENQNIYRCPKCFQIPLISVKDNENKVIIDCPQGHHIEMLFSEYMANEFQKNIYKFKCFHCREEKKNMKICFECQKIICIDCLNLHNKNSPNHHLDTLDQMDIICPIHNSKYSHYCFECKKNLCDECISTKTEKHQLIFFENVNLKDKELEEIKGNLEKEKDTLFKIKTIFNDTLTILSNKFNDIISYKFLCLKYKNNLINSYAAKKTNYQLIDNLNHLKFITKDLKIEPEMNELDIIYELFNFLDSIEYNDEFNNENNNNLILNNNSNGQINYSNMDYKINNENNKIIFDSKNKIEESENEDENEKESENNINNKNLGNENIKVEENEKDDEEEDELKIKNETKESDINRLKNDYIKISESNKEIDKKKDYKKSSDEENENNDKDENNNNSGLLNQISPAKIPNKSKNNNYERRKINEIIVNEKNKNNKNEDEQTIQPNKEDDKNAKEEKNNKENDNDDEIPNENEDNIYVYKSNNHIPVNSEYTKNSIKDNIKNNTLNKDEKSIESESKEKEPKKKRKKIIKKKKLKSTSKDGEVKTIVKIKKNIIQKKKTEEYTSPKKENEEEKDELKEKEDTDEKQDIKPKFNTNNNIHIEINDDDSLENKPTKNIKMNETEENENIDEDESKDYKRGNNDNGTINKSDKKDKSPYNINNGSFSNEKISNEYLSNENLSNEHLRNDNLSNDDNNDNNNNYYKIEEVKNTNHEDFKENKINKRIKTIKKKKKKRLNIVKFDMDKKLNNDHIEIIDIENSNPNGNKIEIINTKKIKQEKDNEISGPNLETIDKNINRDEDINKYKTITSSITNRKSTITKKLNFMNSDKEENDETTDRKNTINSTKRHDFEGHKTINSFSNIGNSSLNYDEQNYSIKRSPMIKKRKKIKKKKYLISLDSKGNLKSTPEDKSIKITKKTTLIRSKSKDKPKERKRSNDTNDSNISDEEKIKNKEVNFKIFKHEGQNSFNFEGTDKKPQKEINNIKKINNINANISAKSGFKKNRKMRIAQGKNNAAFLFENSEEIYLQEHQVQKFKKSGLNKLEKEIDKARNLNKSVDNYKNKTYKGRKFNSDYNYDEIKFLSERSNTFKKSKKYNSFNEKEKINCIKFENGISCILELNPPIFCFGNLIGDIVVINYQTYKEIQTIKEHNGTIISLCLLKDRSILSCSADRKMLKIRLNENGDQYKIEFVFTGYENYIYKGIELMNSLRIITCGWDDKLFVWERKNELNYKNTLKFNEGERVVDLLEINSSIFVSISESYELKIWNSNTLEIFDVIKNIKCITTQNALCKINDFILGVLNYHEIQLIDIMEYQLVNKIIIDDGNLSCCIKLNDNSILVSEDFNSDKYCVFYLKQFYFDDNDLIPISHKKDKFYKSNKNNDKEIRALVQFSNGVIVQGISGEYNGKDSGDLFFYY